jgi:type II secretory pathway pseudopilin PulG
MISHFKKNLGFTLLELITAQVCIMILATIAFTNYKQSVNRARMAEAYVVIGSIEKNLRTHFYETGSFITTPPNPAQAPGIRSYGEPEHFGTSNEWKDLGLPISAGQQVFFSYQAFAGESQKNSPTPVINKNLNSPDANMDLERSGFYSASVTNARMKSYAINSNDHLIDFNFLNSCANANEDSDFNESTRNGNGVDVPETRECARACGSDRECIKACDNRDNNACQASCKGNKSCLDACKGESCEKSCRERGGSSSECKKSCSEPTDDGSDKANDGGSDRGNDEGSDKGNDGGSDRGNDEGSDKGNDGGSDRGNDEGSDTGNDEGSDTGNDGGSDRGNDEGSDRGNDEGSDTGNDDGNSEPDPNQGSGQLEACLPFNVSKPSDFGVSKTAKNYLWAVITAVGSLNKGDSCMLMGKVIQVINDDPIASGFFDISEKD